MFRVQTENLKYSVVCSGKLDCPELLIYLLSTVYVYAQNSPKHSRWTSAMNFLEFAGCC